MLRFVTTMMLPHHVPLSNTRLKLAKFARTCDRYAVADRPAAALASALLHDLSHCSPRHANKNTGKLSHARWLMTANRILQLYMSTREPSEKFKEIARFIIKVYAVVLY
ncbi:hypothetical protein AVEN_27810-1 [Araneus ventricosus]|uniref:Uncharacterized protein n=1 Tax=Araneus ventricosus TaxID=182803 RepID=A0A4Y2EJ84_ARAVE|nr:hypothetical protein AVEN_27810-1 [Araneus ventricosus]